MKVTLNWLKQYVDFDWSPEELAERLTMLGARGRRRRQRSPANSKALSSPKSSRRDPVPGADKLSVCRVNDGKGERTIICGAQNHQAGRQSAADPAELRPAAESRARKTPFVIKERKVFGITSQGMMCSPQELGLAADQVDGLLILPARGADWPTVRRIPRPHRRRRGLRSGNHPQSPGSQQRHRHRPRNRGA